MTEEKKNDSGRVQIVEAVSSVAGKAELLTEERVYPQKGRVLLIEARSSVAAKAKIVP